VHLNGSLIQHRLATVSVFDRGFLFGDGVYEGLRSSRGVVIGLDRHVARMRQGLDEARIRGFDAASLGPLTEELLAANSLQDAFIYWQVTRGCPPGDEGPARARITRASLAPTILGFATPVASMADCRVPEVRKVAVRPDTRWTRGHLKAISLLGGVLAAFEADEAGADDAIMVREGLVTEGTATNVFAVIKGRLVTPALESAPMLAGVTRAMILDADPSIEQRAVTIDELRSAEEVMLVGTKTMVAGVASLDGKPVGKHGAAPGPRTGAMLRLLVDTINREVDQAIAARGEVGVSRG
jgi:D-alanine transaminase